MNVLLVVIDGASPRIVGPAVQTGRLRNLKRIADAGELHSSSATIFPSITPAATTTLVTGAYPVEHGIAGAAWYDPARDEVAYYGDDVWVIAKEGFGAFLTDFLVRLNGDRLTTSTLYELVERTGRSAACVNFLVYRGLVPHKVNVPWLLGLLPGVPLTERVLGPSRLYLGDFVTDRSPRGRQVKDRSGVMHRFGMDDPSSAQILCQLAAEGPLPDLTVAYFADNDFRSHEVGPHQALGVVEAVDEALGAMFDAAGGFERFLRDTAIVITSDHGHCEVLPDHDRAAIQLDQVLGDFRQADVSKGWRERDEIMICHNMRAAQIYLRQPGPGLAERVVRELLTEPRIDQVIWQCALTSPGRPGYSVASARGRLDFRLGRGGSMSARDAYGTEWSWDGDMAALRLDVTDGQVDSHEYPNAFERLIGVLDAPHSGELWVTATPGCEFEVPGGQAHVGGSSHGALHALDSLSPVIAAGVPRLPRAMRAVDIAPLCLAAIGLPMRYAVGDPRRGIESLSSGMPRR